MRTGVCVALAAMLTPTTAAAAMPRVHLSTRFVPEALGKSTTIHYGFTVSEPEPLRSLELRLPRGMGIAGSSLGLEACQPAVLAVDGPEACPRDSRIGYGTVLAEVRAQATVQERAAISALLGPPGPENTMTVLFFVDGKWPTKQEIVLTGQLLLSAPPPYGSTITTQAPLIYAWPEGPPLGLLSFHTTIGPERITYYRRLGNRTVAFAPRGLTLPRHCPRGGFPVQAVFTWWGVEGTANASTRVPCPRARTPTPAPRRRESAAPALTAGLAPRPAAR